LQYAKSDEFLEEVSLKFLMSGQEDALNCKIKCVTQPTSKELRKNWLKMTFPNTVS
jgi:hypothetical protein